MDLKLLFPPKSEAAGCCIELALGIAILAVAAWWLCLWLWLWLLGP